MSPSLFSHFPMPCHNAKWNRATLPSPRAAISFQTKPNTPKFSWSRATSFTSGSPPPPSSSLTDGWHTTSQQPCASQFTVYKYIASTTVASIIKTCPQTKKKKKKIGFKKKRTWKTSEGERQKCSRKRKLTSERVRFPPCFRVSLTNQLNAQGGGKGQEGWRIFRDDKMNSCHCVTDTHMPTSPPPPNSCCVYHLERGNWRKRRGTKRKKRESHLAVNLTFQPFSSSVVTWLSAFALVSQESDIDF